MFQGDDGAMVEGKWKVFVFSPYDFGWDTSVVDECYNQLRRQGCEVVLAENLTIPTREELLGLGKDADAFMGVQSKKERIDEDVLRNAPNLRIIAKYTIGVDEVDLAAATKQGILVTNAPVESTAVGVAENTLALMLALLKKIVLRDKLTRAGVWRPKEVKGVYMRRGVTVGFIGFGRIAQEVNKLLEPWGVKRIVYSPHVPKSVFEQSNVTAVDLETLLIESDVVLVLTSLTPEKRHMIGERELKIMKKTAYLINTARGALIDEKSLVKALKEGWIAGAALDCFEQEPISLDNPLLKLENVILSPHCSDLNEGAGVEVEGVKVATENVLKALRGELPINIVNPDAIPRWIERFGGTAVRLK
ncbi:MAG: NAD(P)-dependent oxidoreductase [Candidatus Bathyarchaeia archaeon]